jgi:hypothetical protein
VFANADVFQHHFGSLQDSEQVHQLQERIRPYVLRRMKGQFKHEHGSGKISGWRVARRCGE